jgi:hypothetical protein
MPSSAVCLRNCRTALLLALALASTSCSAVGGYAKDRILDLSDVIDFKYGISCGLGVKAEASLYAGLGLGLGHLDWTREWYGRRSIDRNEGCFVHFIVGGWDGSQERFDQTRDATEWYQIVLPLNLSALDHPWSPPFIERWRFGGEIVLPVVMGGLYVNVGEIVDFVVGFTTIDLPDDDGVSRSERYGADFEPKPR